jgi:hypothetical protein
LLVVAAPLAAACGLAAARATVKGVPLVVPASQSISSERFRVSPSDIDGAMCLPLAGGTTALVVTVGSGGTAGDIGWAIYVRGSAGYRVALVRGGYKLSLGRAGGDLVETDPVYRKNDPNCCPTGGFDHTQWHWNGTRFVVARTWHDQTYKP